MSTQRIQLISDFNVEPFGRLMSNRLEVGWVVDVAPFGQSYQALSATSISDDAWGSVVWTLPEKSIPSFAQAMGFAEFDVDACLADVDVFADAVLSHARCRHMVIVASWVMPADFRGYGPLDWRPGEGLSYLLTRMNLQLAERLRTAGNVFLIDAGRWQVAGARSVSPKMWYAAKVPYVNAVFDRACADVLAAVRASRGLSRRLLVVDLDDTLWGGVVGETGWEGIRLGGHDHVGEAFTDFQRSLRALTRRGIQIAIVSKNDEQVALEAIDKHPEMQLRRDAFAGWRINWADKAANIEALAQELNLGLASIVFIDDNPAERDRVKEALPDVLVPDWPLDPTQYVTALRALDCFDSVAISQEDRARTAMYVAERERRDVRTQTTSSDDWLTRLDTRLLVAPVSAANLTRVTQLFNKTNQLNLSTRRLSEAEILDWTQTPGRVMLTISASDKFGDMGLVGIVAIEAQADKARITDFILSCRVMGRKVEDAMLHLAAIEARQLGAGQLEATYLPTLRNRPTLDVFQASDLDEVSAHCFESSVDGRFLKPEALTIVFEQ